MADPSKSKGNDTNITTDAAPAAVGGQSSPSERSEREDSLREAVARLQAHNDQLTSQVIALGGKPVAASDAPFVMSEGVAQDIEQHGSAVDPVTGRRLGKEDLPAGRPARTGRGDASGTASGR